MYGYLEQQYYKIKVVHVQLIEFLITLHKYKINPNCWKKISIFFIDTYLLSIVEWYHIVFFCTKWFFPKNTVCLTKFLPDRKNLRFKFELDFESSYLKKYFSKFNSSHKFEFDSGITALNYYIMRLLTYLKYCTSKFFRQLFRWIIFVFLNNFIGLIQKMSKKKHLLSNLLLIIFQQIREFQLTQEFRPMKMSTNKILNYLRNPSI